MSARPACALLCLLLACTSTKLAYSPAPHTGERRCRLFSLTARPDGSLPDLDVLEDSESVGDEDGCGVVSAHEVGGDGRLVDVHAPDGEAGLHLVRDACPMESDDALIIL